MTFVVAPVRRRAAALAFSFGFALLAASAARLVFLYANREVILRQPAGDIWLALAHGPRFDIAALGLLNLPVLVSLLAPLPRSLMLGRIRIVAYLALNVPAFWLNVLDAEYSRFTGKRTGGDLLAFRGDALDQAASLARQYWPFFAFSLLGTALFMVAGRAAEATLARANVETREGAVRKAQARNRWVREGAFFLAGTLLIVLGIRGGLQRKPLTTTHAYLFEANALNLLSLNSALTVLHAGKQTGIPSVSYFPSLADARRVWFASDSASGAFEPLLPPGIAPFVRKDGALDKLNVVVILVESLGSEYMGAGNPWLGHTPFLDSLARKGLSFRQGFANGRRSIEATWSALGGIPSLMDEPYVTSAYKDNTLRALPQVLRREGYSTIFLHGGKNGTMFFDIFARMAGFERYFGMSEYPSERRQADYDGTWGIFDRPFLAEGVRQLSRLPEPFLGAIFTLSSHNPYTLPSGQEHAFDSGAEIPMHKVIRYADAALAAFFEAAAREPWYARTLFVLTGDHTSTSTREEYQNDLGFNRVPILLYSPAIAFEPRLSERLAQHTDIPCTVEQLVGATRQPGSPFCHSLVDPGFRGRILLRAGDVHYLVTPRFWARRTPNGKTTVFPSGATGGFTRPDPASVQAAAAAVTPETRAALARTLESGIQVFANGMNENAFFLEADRIIK